jgi:signal recognition particle subunit SRP54
MRWIPGMGKIAEMMGDPVIEQDLKQNEGIIDSMTAVERENPDVIDFGRRVRIAAGSGTDTTTVNRLLNEFGLMAGMMQQMAGMSKLQQMLQIKQMADGGLFNPGTQMQRRPEPGP